MISHFLVFATVLRYAKLKKIKKIKKVDSQHYIGYRLCINVCLKLITKTYRIHVK